MFEHSNDAAESKMTHEKLCFTIETGAGGHEGRWCQTVVAGYARLFSAMVGYVRLCSAMVGLCLDRSDIEKCNGMLLDALSICNPVPPCARRSTASSNLQSHSPKTLRRHLQSAPLHGVAFPKITVPPSATQCHIGPTITRRLAICKCLSQ